MSEQNTNSEVNNSSNPEAYLKLPFISYRLRGIGEALLGNRGEPPLSGEAIYGIGELLEECACRIYKVYREQEAHDLNTKNSNNETKES